MDVFAVSTRKLMFSGIALVKLAQVNLDQRDSAEDPIPMIWFCSYVRGWHLNVHE